MFFIYVFYVIRCLDKVFLILFRYVVVFVFENWMYWFVGLLERSLLSVFILGWGWLDKEFMIVVLVEINEFFSCCFFICLLFGDVEIFCVIWFGLVLEIFDEF